VLNGDHHTFFSRNVWQVFGDELRYLRARCGLCLRLYLRCLGAGHEPDTTTPPSTRNASGTISFMDLTHETFGSATSFTMVTPSTWTTAGDTAGGPERGAISRCPQRGRGSSVVRAPVSRQCTPFERHSAISADPGKETGVYRKHSHCIFCRLARITA